MIDVEEARALVASPRWLSKVDATGDCHLWIAGIGSQGYGKVWFDGRNELAHRVAYVAHHGADIPGGNEIDHLCRVRHCVNPEHLEAVTQHINMLRGESKQAINARKDECDNSHRFDALNTGVQGPGWRRCIACERQRSRERADAIRAICLQLGIRWTDYVVRYGYRVIDLETETTGIDAAGHNPTQPERNIA